jgi:hypothetical protein
MVNIICKVCSGKGGWKKKADYWYDDNWEDCLYCEGLGFVESEEPLGLHTSFLLQYNGYKKIITDIIDSFGKLISYQTTDQGRTIEISIVPNNRAAFTDFTKALLKFSHYNSRMKVSVNQVFFFEPSDGLYHYYWKILLTPLVMSDLDGFVDLIRAWEANMKARRISE